jgi:hypothetical protein
MSETVKYSEIPTHQLAYRELIAGLTGQIHGKELNHELDSWLNQEYGVQSDFYLQIKNLTEIGVKEGWLCNREGAGIKYGRIFKSSEDMHGFSVDVVEMENIVGPKHEHPLGEIDLIMPIQGEAQFDNRPAGWMVAPPKSVHSPTVTNGRAYVLYLLPQGQIQFI